jgi:hydroxylamine dehydrogenase
MEAFTSVPSSRTEGGAGARGRKTKSRLIIMKIGFSTVPVLAVAVSMLASVRDARGEEKRTGEACEACHLKHSPALVAEWKRSLHAQNGVGCVDCHGAKEGEPDAWKHFGVFVSALVTPRDCAECHEEESAEFATSHHAKAGEILASLDNVLAEKVAGTPTNKADAVNGCWQCHGSMIRFKRDEKGAIVRQGEEGQPVIDPTTWPNTGIGRMNPDGSRGSCNACHPRHSFDAKIARAPENCGKCHMGPDHPQIEIYNESKHGIAFQSNRDRMALDKDGAWVLGKDYSAAPTCATCHIGSHMTEKGEVVGRSHDVGERISWTLRPVISTKLNLVTFEDGYKEDYPEGRALPKIGETVDTGEKIVENEQLVTKKVPRKVKSITTWEARRAKMQAVCLNCHSQSHVDGFYQQFDDLVTLYNEKFAKPAQAMMDDLIKDGVLKKDAPFEHEVQWIFWELWHHEGRRARHGASMMGPDYTHWHGMYEVSKHYYTEFLPAVVKAAAEKSPALGTKYQAMVDQLLTRPEHQWLKGLSPAEAEMLRKTYEQRYNR